MGVVFFPSLPFMRVMLFPSFVLGNASEEGGAFLVPLSLFYVLLSLPLLSSLSPSPSFSLLFLFHSLFLPFFFSSTSHSPLFFFFFEETACTVYFRSVLGDTTDRN